MFSKNPFFKIENYCFVLTDGHPLQKPFRKCVFIFLPHIAHDVAPFVLRMRRIGYPPGYTSAQLNKDVPSDIIVHGEDCEMMLSLFLFMFCRFQCDIWHMYSVRLLACYG
jgi:hypothetical protein